MKKDLFRAWLKRRGIKNPGDFISKITAIEKYYGNIDNIYDKNHCVKLISLFKYTSQDKQNKIKPRHLVPIKKYKNKNIYDTYMNTTQDYHSRLNRYVDFRNDLNNSNFYPDSANTESCIEGAKTSVNVNKYERSYMARQKCIDTNGCYCHICGLNFENRYGKIGKDFIHVHHIIPLNEVSEEYIVNPIKDLIPVCPNCHAMLHRKINGKYMSIEELKTIVNK